jgi:prevent-host-death family protein
MATTIPQRELRNQAGAVLRRAERGERFTITVDGRRATVAAVIATHDRCTPGDRP